MQKRAIKKKSLGKTTTKSTEPQIERVLVENFVSLQKVMVNLSVKFDGLTKQISKLLDLFEISAKELAKKDIESDKAGKNKKIIEKIDNLFEQNKVIARGLTLIHEKIPGEEPETTEQKPQQFQPPRNPQVNAEKYQRSISSQRPPEFER
jgi:RNA-binding protein YhbY